MAHSQNRLNFNLKSFLRKISPAQFLRTKFDALKIKLKDARKKYNLEAREWLSWKLSNRMLSGYFVLNIVIVTVIVVLWCLSKQNHGIVQTSDAAKPFLQLSWGLGLLWTALPALLFQIHSLGFVAMITAFLFRQPFVELRVGAVGDKTIFLDYLSLLPCQREWRAWKNGHRALVIASCMSYLFTLCVVPFSSRLFADAPYMSNEPVILAQNTSFVLRYQPDTTLSWDLAPALGIASATTTYGARYPRWSGPKYAFQSFADPDRAYADSFEPNMTATTLAYGADLDCVPLSPSQYNYSPVPGGSNTSYSIQMSGTDRGCKWSTTLQVSALWSTYLQTSNNSSCPSYNGSDGSGRLVVVGAESPVTVEELTVLSCIPRYSKLQAKLTVSLMKSDDRSIINTVEDSSTTEMLQPDWWKAFEDQLGQVVVRDTSQTASQADSTNTYLARLILEYSRRTNKAGLLSGTSLMNATRAIYSATYSILMASQLTMPMNESTSVRGVLTTTTQRVFVVDFVAGFIISAFFLADVTVGMIFLHTRSHPSVLREEPVSIVGYAGLQYNSIVMEDVERARSEASFDGRTTKFIREGLERGRLNDKIYRMDEVDDEKKAHITRS